MLGNGNVLLAAGENDIIKIFGYLSSAELQPYNGQIWHYRTSEHTPFPAYGPLARPRTGSHVVGNHFGSIASVELYDPAKGTFSNTASLNHGDSDTSRRYFSNGQVLAVGGYESQLGSYRGYLGSAELFHRGSDIFFEIRHTCWL